MSESKKIYSPWQRWALGWLPLWLITAVIIKGALWPGKDIPHFFLRFNDKLIHAAEYFVCCAAALNAFRRAQTGWVCQSWFWLALAYSVFLGAVTEILQIWVPGRSCEWLDLLSDSCGAFTALAAWHVSFKNETTRG